MEQDPALADALLAIANAAGTLYGGFDWPKVLERSAAALALDPSLDLAHVARMRAFYHLGAFEEARREAQRARTLNPSPSVEFARLQVASDLFAGQFTDAVAEASALLQQTDAPAVRHYLGLARYYTGDVDGARTMLASAMRSGRPDVRSQASLASIEAAAGLRDQARRRADDIAHGTYMDHHVAYSLGAAYAQLGDLETAVKWLRQSATTGFACYPWYVRDPLLSPLRNEAAFANLINSIRDSQ